VSAGFLSPEPRQREISDLGVVVPGALLNTYVSGTTVRLATTSDAAGLVPNTNPIVASAGGLFGPIYLTPGLAYKYVLTDALGGPIWDQDPIRVDVAIAVTEAQLLLSDVLTDNVSIAAHGFAPKAPNDVTKFLNGLGAFSVPPYPGALPGMSLVWANSGTNASAVAANVDTVAIAGLTAKDTLLIVATMGSTTQPTSGPGLFNNTDSVSILADGTALGTNTVQVYNIILRQRQTAATAIVAQGSVGNTDASGNPHSTFKTTGSTFATPWTGAWTLALRHAGVTAGGTCDWSWAVYKIAGQ
jgi:hypothetical protein